MDDDGEIRIIGAFVDISGYKSTTKQLRPLGCCTGIKKQGVIR